MDRKLFRLIMAEQTELQGFIGGSYPTQATAFDSERSINLQPAPGTQSTKSQLMLIGTPGLDLLSNISNSPIRGIHQVNNFWYIITGDQVWQLDLGLTFIQATGTLNTSGGLVSMAHNNNSQLCIVDGQNIYICTTGTLIPALTTITNYTDTPFDVIPKPSSVCFLGQYFIVSLLDSQEFIWSNVNDGTLWNTLDFESAANSPDPLVAVAASNGYLYLLGSDSTEIWTTNPTQQVIGGLTIIFPFNYTGSIIPFGLAGANAVANINNGLMWLTGTTSTSPHIIFTQGAQEQILSTPGIEQLIGSYGNFSNAFSMVSHLRGGEIFILSFPNNDSTICFDFQTKMFHERSYYNGQTWLPSCIASFGTNVEIAGDRTTGNIYYLDPDVYTDNGDPIVRTRITPHFATSDDYNYCYELLILMEPGVGNTNPPGDDPVATIECSTDYGHTFGNQRAEKIGKKGKYRTRVQWHRFGRGRDFVFKFICAEPVKVCLIKAFAEFESGIN
jgi:hypothetical protein